MGIIISLSPHGVPLLRRTLVGTLQDRSAFRDYISSIVSDGGVEGYAAPMRGAIWRYSRDYQKGTHKPKLLEPEEEDSQEVGITSLWKSVKAEMEQDYNAWCQRGIMSATVKPWWTLDDFRARGWVFLDAPTFRVVEKYWDSRPEACISLS